MNKVNKAIWHYVKKNGEVIAKPLIVLLIGFAGLKLFWDFALRISIETLPGMHGDSLVYMAAGRGILNGLIPYRDLMEIKPPGIFFLSALSILVSEGETLARGLQILFILLIPFILILFSLQKSRSKPWFLRAVLLCFSFAIGTSLAMHTLWKARAPQTEGFGVFFSFLYVLVFAWDRRNISQLRLILASILIFLSISFKEPFFLALLASAIILSPKVSSFIKGFLVPLLFATLAGLLLMVYLGYLGPYINDYLPVILNDRVKTNFSLLIRGIVVQSIYEDLVHYSFIPLIGYACIGLWISIPVSKYPHSLTWKRTTLVTLLTIAGLLLISNIYEIYRYIRLEEFGSSLTYVLLASIVLIVAWAYAWRKLKKDRKTLGTFGLQTMLATYLITLGVGAGNFLFNHYALAVPAIFAAFFLFHEAILRQKHQASLYPITIFTGLMIFLSFFTNPNNTFYTDILNQESRVQDTTFAIQTAGRLDAMMDHCKFERYVSWHEQGITAFTRHSPSDLPWVEVRSFYGKELNPELRLRYFQRLEAAPIFVTYEQYLDSIEDPALQQYLLEKFDLAIPTCAKQDMPINGLAVLFRREK